MMDCFAPHNRLHDGKPSLRIAIVVSQWGAPTQTFVRREVAAAQSAGHDLWILSLKAPPPDYDRSLPITQLSVTSIAIGFLQMLCSRPRLVMQAVWRAARYSRPSTSLPNLAGLVTGVAASTQLPSVDWIHAHFAWVAASAADGLAAVRRQAFSVFPHAFDIFDEHYIDGYTGDKLRRAAVVVVESEAIRDEVNSRFGCSAEVAKMGVDASWVLDVMTERNPEFGLVVTVGSLVPKKGHDVLVRALAELGEARLVIVGVGPEHAALSGLIEELGIGARVQLVGALAEKKVRDLLDRADVFCLASRPTPTGDRDGVPNVLIEAMARGVPVVSTAVSGIPDLLGEERGLIVAPNDSRAIAAALRSVLATPVEARRRAQRGLDHVRGEYQTDRNWARLEQRFRSAMHG